MEQHEGHIYRINENAQGWEVSAFFKGEHVGPVVTYTDAALPEWIRKRIAILKLVDNTGSVLGVGHRVGVVFWLTNYIRTEHD